MAAAQAISAGHAFVIRLSGGFPVNVLNPVKAVPEVCTIFCATANPDQILVASTDRGRGVAGVVDGSPPVGVETDADAASRHRLLREMLSSPQPRLPAVAERVPARATGMAPIVSLIKTHIASDLVGDTGIEPVTSSV